MMPSSFSPSLQPKGYVRPQSNVKGDSKRVQQPISNRPCPHVSLPRDRRSISDPIWGMLLLAFFHVPFFR